MRIHENPNGIRVNAISRLADSTDVNGTLYQVNMDAAAPLELKFHSGPIDRGLTGLTNEALLAILTHRLGVVDGICPSEENKAALHYIGAAHQALNARVANREARNVSGTKEI